MTEKRQSTNPNHIRRLIAGGTVILGVLATGGCVQGAHQSAPPQSRPITTTPEVSPSHAPGDSVAKAQSLIGKTLMPKLERDFVAAFNNTAGSSTRFFVPGKSLNKYALRLPIGQSETLEMEVIAPGTKDSVQIRKATAINAIVATIPNGRKYYQAPREVDEVAEVSFERTVVNGHEKFDALGIFKHKLFTTDKSLGKGVPSKDLVTDPYQVAVGSGYIFNAIVGVLQHDRPLKGPAGSLAT